MTTSQIATPGMGDILLYQAPDGSTEVNVTLEKDTVWLNQKQMADLFGKDYKTISEHIRNIYQEKELEKNPTIWKSQTVQLEGKRHVKRAVLLYNLDVIISVGYRVKSQRGTQFRIWATQRLKEYLLKGYLLNQKRLAETKLTELEHVVALIKRNIAHGGLSQEETSGLLHVITQYTHSWILLQKYDEESLQVPALHALLKEELTYQEALYAVEEMKKTFLPQGHVSQLFGVERNHEFKGIVQSIYQSFDGQDLYPSVEEKAAYLLYFVIKNHPFADGNKKI